MTPAPPHSTWVLDARHLRKAYGERTAVHDIILAVAPGQVLGLLGPNGAGKSTTLSMVAGLTPPDSGEVVVAGTPVHRRQRAAQRHIGLVTQDLALVDELSAWENLRLFGALYGLRGPALRQRAEAVLAQVGLADRIDDKPATFSGGMKRRLHLAAALLHDPALLLLDEPTAGVDPQSRNAIFETLLALKAAGKALVYTTHYMEEVERLADAVVIVDHGRVVAHGSVAELVARLPAAQKLELDVGAEAAASTELQMALQALPSVRAVAVNGPRLVLAVDELTRASAAALALLASRGVVARHLGSGRANLEDVFLALTGRQLRD